MPLPIKNIQPIFLTLDKQKMNKPYQLALILQEPVWLEVEFNANGVQHISPKLTGVYQVVNEAGQVLRIGEGAIQSRLKEHLKDNDLWMGRKLLYFVLANKADGKLVEHVFLMQYKQEHGGRLPPGNSITA